MAGMLVKIISSKQHLKDLKKVFVMLKKYRIKLNLTKCVLGMKAWKFLDFLVNRSGIELNPKKFKSLIDISLPITFKEVQVLIK